MPEFEGVENFPSATDDLTKVPIAEWCVFSFVSLDPIASFDQFTAGFEHRIDPGKLKLTSSREYEIRAHWALYCENYLEGFHIPFVHHSLNEIVDYASYRTDLFDYSSLQTGYDADDNEAGRYFYIFPNLMFNFYPWGLSINLVKPISPSSPRLNT